MGELPSRAARKSAANEEPLALVDQVHGAQPPTEGGGAAKRVRARTCLIHSDKWS